MERPEVPRAWRLAVGGAGVILLAGAATGDAPAVYAPILAGLVGLTLAFGMAAKGEPRDRWAAFAGFGIAILFGILLESPLGILIGLGVGVPASLVASRPQPVATLVTALGLAATVLGLSMLMRDRGAMNANLQLRGLIVTVSFCVLAIGLLLHAALARSEAVPASRAPSRARRLALVGLGAVFLALGWAMGGFVFGLIPLWPFALAALVLPILISWRAWPAGALVTGAIALAGGLPVGTCLADPYSDAVGPGDPAADAHRQLVTLAQVGSYGPGWLSGDGFSGARVTCSPPLLALGALWALALVGAATFAAAKRPAQRLV